jgi:5'-nucleotidase/UDP-sugar diphosphatase
VKTADLEPAAATDRTSSSTLTSIETFSRRKFLAESAAAGAVLLLPGSMAAAADRKKTFTILHTNDLHSNLIGMAPSQDYTPFTLNDDATRGGFARLATLIAKRKGAQGSWPCSRA